MDLPSKSGLGALRLITEHYANHRQPEQNQKNYENIDKVNTSKSLVDNSSENLYKDLNDSDLTCITIDDTADDTYDTEKSNDPNESVDSSSFEQSNEISICGIISSNNSGSYQDQMIGSEEELFNQSGEMWNNKCEDELEENLMESQEKEEYSQNENIDYGKDVSAEGSSSNQQHELVPMNTTLSHLTIDPTVKHKQTVKRSSTSELDDVDCDCGHVHLFTFSYEPSHRSLNQRPKLTRVDKRLITRTTWVVSNI